MSTNKIFTMINPSPERKYRRDFHRLHKMFHVVLREEARGSNRVTQSALLSELLYQFSARKVLYPNNFAHQMTILEQQHPN